MKNILKCLLLLIFLSGFFTETSAKLLPGENIFQLQFNKSLFVSGEKIWFKNSLVSGHNNGHQNILFVDLCGEGSIISSRILVRENDHWQGDIFIPDSLETGIYVFRAYIGDYEGKPEMISKLVTVINRFGNNQNNQKRKINPGYKPLDLINQLPDNSGQVLKTYTNSTVYKTKELVECWVEKEKAEFPTGISFSVFRIPETLFNDSVPSAPVNYESMVEYGAGENTKIYNRLTLSGKVIGKKSKEPVAGEVVLFSIPDSIPQINYATTNENGEFCFELDDYYGQQDIIVQTLSKSEDFEIVLLSNLLNPPVKIPFYLPAEMEGSDFVNEAVQRSLLQKAYLIEEEGVRSKPEDQYKYPFYGTTSNVVIPARFVELNDFEEITKEILPLCRIRKEKGKLAYRINDQTNYGFFDYPWILVDGIPVYDIKKLSPLNSSKIKRIETQPQVRCYGDLLIEGALSIITTNGNFKDVPLPANAVRTPFQTFYRPNEYSGNHFVKNQNLADFKDVLFWNPMLGLIPNVYKTNIQCSYEKGAYIAVAEAIDQDGVVQRSVCKFKVE